MIKHFFFSVGNACSEYRFEVTPELELLFLKLSLRLLKLSMQSQQTPLHTLYICIYLYLTTENCLKMIYGIKKIFRLRMMIFDVTQLCLHLLALVKE